MHAKENGGVMGKRMIRLPLEQIIPDTMHEKWVNLLETKCGVTLPVEDEKRRTFVKRWEEARVSRSQPLAILLKAPQEVSSTLYPSPANQHPPPNDDCSSVGRLLCHALTTLVMQAHVQIKETTLSITRASRSLPPMPLSPSTLRTNELSTNRGILT